MANQHVHQNIHSLFYRLHETIDTSLWLYMHAYHNQPLSEHKKLYKHLNKLSETEYERLCYDLSFRIFYLAPIAAPTMLHDYIQFASKDGEWNVLTIDELTQHVIEPGMQMDATFRHILENLPAK